MSEKVRTVEYESASAFLTALRMNRPEWSQGAGAWLFRGHADAAWPLRPTAFRSESWIPFGGLPAECDGDTADIELGELLWFAQGLDRAGLLIPGATRAQIDNWIWSSMGRREWIKKLTDLMALAQHHGFPTRLLDFSYSSLVAAYFAALPLANAERKVAKEACEKSDAEADKKIGEKADQDPEKLCVWAIDSNVVSVYEDVPSGEWCAVVRATRAGNDHLIAQDGAFVVWEREDLALEEILESIDPDPYRPHLPPDKWRTGPSAFKLVLPRAEASELLGLLSAERITGARLFPGPRGVVLERKEQTHHNVFPHDRTTRWPRLIGLKKT